MRRAILVSVAIVFLYAISDEFHQYFVPGRSSEIRDVLIDTTAGVVGVIVYVFVERLVYRRSHKKSQHAYDGIDKKDIAR